jgi:hypothetical protein
MKAGFYAVVGNSDYIRLNESRIPIWELLDEQPTGWLRSLASRSTTVLPDRQPRIAARLATEILTFLKFAVDS